MRKLAIGIIAAGTFAAAGATAPAIAQIVVDTPVLDFRIGPNHPGYRHYNYDRGHHYGWRNRDRGCRTVTVRERRPDGTMVTRTRERC